MATVEVRSITDSTNFSDIKRVSVSRSLNAPASATIVLANVRGAKSFAANRGDVIRIKASPDTRTTIQTCFYGFITDIESTRTDFRITALDALGYLTNEVLLTNPTSIASRSDGASIIKEIVSGSNYNLDLGKMIGQTRIVISDGLSLTGRSRLDAVQTVMKTLNSTPNRFRIQGQLDSLDVIFDRLPEVDNSDFVAYIAGRLPRTSAPLDIYPTEIEREETETDYVNVVTVQNSNLNIEVTEPTTTPTNPIQRLYEDNTVTDEAQARMVARQILNQQGFTKNRWIVEADPHRFDIVAGDIIEFKSIDGGLAGRQMVFDVLWNITPDTTSMRLVVGRQEPDFLSSIRYAANISL